MAAQIVNTLLGIWLMAAPAILDYNGAPADNSHIIGPVIASFATIALSGATRGVARFNIVTGGWLLMAPLFLGYEDATLVFNDIIVGIIVMVLSFSERKASHQYGGGWKSLRNSKDP